MSKIIFSMSEYYEEFDTYNGYYEQFKSSPNTISIDDIFVVHPNTWQEQKVKIVVVYENIALGVNVSGLSIGSKCLYYSMGKMIGWKYNDNRHTYRLQNLND